MSPRRLPAEIYWRRRLLVLAAVIALVWVGLRLAGGDDEPEADPAPTVTATTAPPTAAAPPIDGTVEVSLSTSPRACDPENVRVTPTVNPGQFAGGVVTIGLVVSSTDTEACTLSPADADLLTVISANKSAVWDSTVCKTSLLKEPIALSPRWSSLVTTEWSGRGSGAKCSAKEGFASPGEYVVQAGTLGGEPGKTSFSLTRKPAPKTAAPATKTAPTPKKTPAPAVQ